MNENLSPPDLEQTLSYFRNRIFAEMNCVKIGKIESYDTATQTAEIQLQIKAQYGSGKIVDYPLLVDCPVMILQGGGSFIDMPISQGDYCIVLFNDRDIDIWWQSANVRQPNTKRKHDLSDGMAIVGLNPKTEVLDIDGSKVVIQAVDVNLDLNGDQINLNGNSKSFVTYGELNSALQTFVAAVNLAFASKLDGGGSSPALTLNISASETITVKTGG